MPHGRWESLTIANGAAVSSAVWLAYGERIAIVKTDPDGWTAADICFQVSDDGGTSYDDLTDITDALIRITNVDQDQMRAIADDLNNVSFPLGANPIKLRSVNTASEADVNQGAARTLRVFLVKD